jgi:hypothetical protein
MEEFSTQAAAEKSLHHALLFFRLVILLSDALMILAQGSKQLCSSVHKTKRKSISTSPKQCL